MLRVVILDDDLKMVEKMKREILRTFNKRCIDASISIFTHGVDFLKALNANKKNYDVVFQETVLPDISGLDVAREIRLLDKDIFIAFITSHDEYVFDAFDYDAISYIRKSELDIKIDSTVSRIIKKYVREKHEILFKYQGELYKNYIENIIYFESFNHTISLNDNKGHVFHFNDSLSNLEEMLTTYHFCRIHSSFLVNLKYVKIINKYTVCITLGDKLIEFPVSRRRLMAVREAFINYTDL